MISAARHTSGKFWYITLISHAGKHYSPTRHCLQCPSADLIGKRPSSNVARFPLPPSPTPQPPSKPVLPNLLPPPPSHPYTFAMHLFLHYPRHQTTTTLPLNTQPTPSYSLTHYCLRCPSTVNAATSPSSNIAHLSLLFHLNHPSAPPELVLHGCV